MLAQHAEVLSLSPSTTSLKKKEGGWGKEEGREGGRKRGEGERENRQMEADGTEVQGHSWLHEKSETRLGYMGPYIEK